MLDEKYKEMYEGYYDDAVDMKRAITARETMGHLKQLLGTERVGALIDVGAGQGSLVECLERDGAAERITALEISASGLQRIKLRELATVEAVPFDGYTAPFADKSFDLALSIHVLEHVEHERLFLREIARISRRAIIEVPLELRAAPGGAIRRMAEYGHINFYTRETFENVLKTAGLTPTKIIVNSCSLELDRYLAPGPRGILKHLVRRSALKAWPWGSQKAFVYLATALCDCDVPAATSA